MIPSKKIMYTIGFPEFKDILTESERSYSWLTSLCTYLSKQEDSKLNRQKISWIQEKRQQLLDAGKVKTKRRIPGTGTKVITKKPYKDTVDNRKAGRVGKFYDVVTYENAEYDERVQTNMRRVKKKRRKHDEDGEPVKKKQPGLWIMAMDQAKRDMNITGFVKVRKTVTNESSDEQVFEHKVYLRAKHIHEKLKAQEKARKEAEKSRDHSHSPEPERKYKKRRHEETRDERDYCSDSDSVTVPAYSPYEDNQDEMVPIY